MTRLEKKILVNRLKTHFDLKEIAKLLAMSNSTVVKYAREVSYGV